MTKEDVRKALKKNIFIAYILSYLLVAIPMVYYAGMYIKLFSNQFLLAAGLCGITMVCGFIFAYFLQSKFAKNILLFLSDEEFDNALIKKEAYNYPLYISSTMIVSWIIFANSIAFIPIFIIFKEKVIDLVLLNLMVFSGALLSMAMSYLVSEGFSSKLLVLEETRKFKEPDKVLRIELSPKILGVCLTMILCLLLNISVALIINNLYTLSKIEELINILIISIQAFLATIIISSLLAGSIKRAITNMKNVIDELKDKGGDLTIVLPKLSNDELADTSSSFNDFLRKLSDIVSEIKNSTKSTNENVDSLQVSMNDTDVSISEIGKISDEVESVTITQSSVIAEFTASIEEIARTIEQQDVKINDQSVNVIESSSAIEEMLKNIQNISNNLNMNYKEFEHLKEVIGVGKDSIDRLKENVSLLNKYSNIVLDANGIIENIASQTNLLAMNASIEAAHAGESGKGFAVVAGEIRKLAEGANQQSKLISDNLKNLKSLIDGSVDTTSETDNSFEDIIKSVDTVSKLEKEIKNSIDEQANASSQILEALGTITKITEEVHRGSNEMIVGSEQIIAGVSSLTDITEKVKNASVNVKEKSGIVKENASKSIELLSFTKENAEKIDGAVSVFKVE